MPTLNRRTSHLLAVLTAGWFCLTTCHTEAFAAHCGCESSCQVCPPPHVQCGCGCKRGKKVNCLQKALDSLSAGFDKMLSFGKRGCDDRCCDDACDAAMIEELMVPMVPPTLHHDHEHGAHQNAHPHEAHSHEPHAHAQEAVQEQPVEEMPPPVRLQDPPSDPDRGSLFETESDPFGDDDARARTYRPIRPSAYQRVELRPINPPAQRQSSRRVHNAR